MSYQRVNFKANTANVQCIIDTTNEAGIEEAPADAIHHYFVDLSAGSSSTPVLTAFGGKLVSYTYSNGYTITNITYTTLTQGQYNALKNGGAVVMPVSGTGNWIIP